MKLFKFATLAVAVFGQSTYNPCRNAENCDHQCGEYENCDGTGKKGIISYIKDTACCGMADADKICTGDDMEMANCNGLPANITAISGGAFACCNMVVPETTAALVTGDTGNSTGVVTDANTGEPGEETTAKTGTEATLEPSGAPAVGASLVTLFLSLFMR